MFRSTLLSLFLVAAAATSVLGNPDTQVSLQGGEEAHTSESWSYDDCGKRTSPLSTTARHLTGSHQGLPTDVIQLDSIKIKPDPPKPGQDLTVIVKGYVQERIEVWPYLSNRGALFSPPLFRREPTQTLLSSWVLSSCYKNHLIFVKKRASS